MAQGRTVYQHEVEDMHLVERLSRVTANLPAGSRESNRKTSRQAQKGTKGHTHDILGCSQSTKTARAHVHRWAVL